MENKDIILASEIKEWDEVTEVVVIGSGFAGLTAAIEAHNNGASVVVLEKMKAPGGNSIISDGGIAAPGTKLQEKFGVKDSADQMFNDMVEAGLGRNDEELVRVLVDEANNVFEWSMDYLDIEYMDRIDIFGGHSVLRCYTALNITGDTIIKKQMKKLNELGVEVRLSTYVKGLIVDDNGRVCGLLVMENYNYRDPDKGSQKLIKVEKGVILATGGFGGDIAFRMEQDPRLDDKIDTTNKPFATAEVMKEAMKLGAATVDLSYIQLGPWASPDEKRYGVGPMFSEYIVFQYGMIVNPFNGKRFVNELSDRKTLSDKLLEIGHPCIGIADEKAVKQSGWNIDTGLIREVVRRFDSLDELANFYKIPVDALNESIKRFNGSFEKGEDPDFNKPLIENASAIENPPYYAMRLWPKVHFTMGGLKINANAQVINKEGSPIEGLYAAGEVTGGVHGASRLGSCAITDCMVFGRIAGREITK